MDFEGVHTPLPWCKHDTISALPQYEPPSDLQYVRPYTRQHPFMDQSNIHPALREKINGRTVIYASVRRSLPRIKTDVNPCASPIAPSTPTSQRSSLSSDDDLWIQSNNSDTSSIFSDASSTPSSHSPRSSIRTLRRSPATRRGRRLSLREIRQKQSEADLQRVYTSSVEEYLSGELFEKFRIRAEPTIIEDI